MEPRTLCMMLSTCSTTDYTLRSILHLFSFSAGPGATANTGVLKSILPVTSQTLESEQVAASNLLEPCSHEVSLRG